MSEFKLRAGDVDGAGTPAIPGSGRRSESAAVRGPDRELYLFPRLGSRKDITRVLVLHECDSMNPAIRLASKRLGIALEPEAV